jgi:predicted glycogen debranching enzyme
MAWLLYPPGLKHAAELSLASRVFLSIELNGSFYSLQRPTSYAKWYQATPPDFAFAIKGGHFIIHLKACAGCQAQDPRYAGDPHFKLVDSSALSIEQDARALSRILPRRRRARRRRQSPNRLDRARRALPGVLGQGARRAAGGAMNERQLPVDSVTEWLETDGLGGFASGTSSGLRTRRYHALLLAATAPPAGRQTLVQGFVARLDTPRGSAELWPQAYAGGWTTGNDLESVEFSNDPWPSWRISTRLGVSAEVEIFVPHGSPAAVVSFKLAAPTPGAKLELRPLLSGRDFHATHHENSTFRHEPEVCSHALRWRPYEGVPSLLALSNGEYRHTPDWYRNFFYAEEAARGLDAEEDLAAPGVFHFDVAEQEALWVVSADLPGKLALEQESVRELVSRLRQSERQRRSGFKAPLERAADQYLVRRGQGRTLIAGYPWFGDWGRDTFIALRGLCLALGDLETARSILSEWAMEVSEGLLPNRFSDDASAPAEYNSVDASLWFVLAADELLSHPAAEAVVSAAERRRIESAIDEIVIGYARGTRHGIRRDEDGLLACGEAGVQLTWMDAKVGDWVVTPRIGKPVEVQALWVHSLLIAAKRDPRLLAWADAARLSLERRFWNEERGMLFDVVDDGHRRGAVDAACRPNQIFAAGGLPSTLLSPERARRVVEAVERELWTPLGLRSLERDHPAYVPRYEGGVRQRDGAYHQGTVWPWLIGPFVEAWVKVRGNTDEAKLTARQSFLAPFDQHLARSGLGHVSEIADGEPPHTPRGCPFQAWSVAELLRLDRVVLAAGATALSSTSGVRR